MKNMNTRIAKLVCCMFLAQVVVAEVRETYYSSTDCSGSSLFSTVYTDNHCEVYLDPSLNYSNMYSCQGLTEYDRSRSCDGNVSSQNAVEECYEFRGTGIHALVQSAKLSCVPTAVPTQPTTTAPTAVPTTMMPTQPTTKQPSNTPSAGERISAVVGAFPVLMMGVVVMVV
jgi:hypothetical protein